MWCWMFSSCTGYGVYVLIFVGCLLGVVWFGLVVCLGCFCTLLRVLFAFVALLFGWLLCCDLFVLWMCVEVVWNCLLFNVVCYVV